MSEEKKTANKKPKNKAVKHKNRKMDRSTLVLIIGLVIIAIPCLILGWILISASLETGTPINGNRFKGDLDPAITKDQLKQIEETVKTEDKTEEVTVELATATLRVYVDAADSITEEEAKTLAQTVYSDVTSICDEAVYFTAAAPKKMYDLEIHVYNSLDAAGTPEYVYVIQSKNSGMAEAHQQVVSKPLDPELAQQLRDELEEKRNPKPEEEAEEEVSSEDNEGETENNE